MFNLHKRCQAERDTLADEVKYLRRAVDRLQERNDRLVEALSRKDGVQLSLPIEPHTPPTDGSGDAPILEMMARANKGVGEWARAMNSGHSIATPVKEVSAP